MASMTIRNIDDDVKRALRLQAERRGVSMAAEARRLLSEGLETEALAVSDKMRPTGETPLQRLERIKDAHGGGFEIDRSARSVEEVEEDILRMLALGRRPDEAFDQKTETDELWDFAE